MVYQSLCQTAPVLCYSEHLFPASLQWFKDNIEFIYFSLYCAFQLMERTPCSELNLQASQAPSQLRAKGLVHKLVKSP